MTEGADDIDAIRERKRRELLERASGDGDGAAAGDEATSTPGRPIPVEDEGHFEELVASQPTLLVDFHAEWCGPCRMLAPTIDRLAREGAIAVGKVDIDRLPGLAQRYGVRGVPTLLFFAGGEPAERLVGVQDESTLRERIRALPA